MIQHGNLLLGPSAKPKPQPQPTPEQAIQSVAELYLEQLAEHIRTEIPILEPEGLAVKSFMYLFPGFDRKKILDLAFEFSYKYLNSEEFNRRKTFILSQLLRENLDKNDVIQRIIDCVTQLKDVGGSSFHLGSYRARDYFVNSFSWAIPSIEAIKSIRQFADSGQILEVGSGLGLWAALIRANGGDIIPTDSFTTHDTSSKRIFIGTYPMDALSAVNAFPTPVLFFCWPGYGESWAHESLKAFKGSKFIFIGEGQDGCTANDEFFDLLSEEWEENNDYCHEFPHWDGIYDYLSFYTRKPVKVEDNSWTLVQTKKESHKRTPSAQATHTSTNSYTILCVDSVDNVNECSWTYVQTKKEPHKSTASARPTHISSNRYSILCVDSVDEC